MTPSSISKTIRHAPQASDAEAYFHLQHGLIRVGNVPENETPGIASLRAAKPIGGVARYVGVTRGADVKTWHTQIGSDVRDPR